MCTLGVLWRFESQDARSALQAKSEYRAVLRKHTGWGLDDHAASVIFAELVANVIRHAPGSIKISLECDGKNVLLSVADNGRGFRFAPPSTPDTLSPSGRGLFIVSRYAHALRVVPAEGGGTDVIASLRSSSSLFNFDYCD
jgi:anti-sigma regulatory factor (Ser/Thr protein kinase)